MVAFKDPANHPRSMFYPTTSEVLVKKGIQVSRSIEFEKRPFLIWKRCFDLITSVLLLILIMTWLIPLVSFLILLDSGGPVFFSQRRVGRRGKTFLCFKFRTMCQNKEADERQAMENDARITRLGKFLRKTNIDEFPQLFNVFLGQMSIVGPRPYMVSDCIKFSAQIPDYTFRDIMKPGMTGLSQVRGYSGPIANWESLFKRFQWDTFYIRNATFWLDLRIIQQTAFQRIKFLIQYLTNRED